MITKYGYKIIIYNGFLLAVLLSLFTFNPSNLLILLSILTGIFFLFHFFFFRDPQRNVPEGKDIVISPADGKIIKICEIEENKYIQGKAKMVSIFMSIFNVHVNRIPISGTVEFLEHKAGKFKIAYKDSSSDLNEQSIIGIKSSHTKILFKQIAGIVARRIINQLKVGENVKIGERFGMIKYGSRLDVVLPISATINIRINDKVKAGETIIAKI